MLCKHATQIIADACMLAGARPFDSPTCGYADRPTDQHRAGFSLKKKMFAGQVTSAQVVVWDLLRRTADPFFLLHDLSQACSSCLRSFGIGADLLLTTPPPRPPLPPSSRLFLSLARALRSVFLIPRAAYIMQKLDHIGIYLVIAGTMTPFMLVNMSSAAAATWLVCVEWRESILAALACARAVFARRSPPSQPMVMFVSVWWPPLGGCARSGRVGRHCAQHLLARN